jgi:integrase
MPRQYQLTYDRSLKQWVKVIHSKKRYFGKASSKGNVADYERALERYRHFMAQESAQPSLSGTLTPRQLQAATEGVVTGRRRYTPRLVEVAARHFIASQVRRATFGEITPTRVIGLRNNLRHFVQHCEGKTLSLVTSDTLLAYSQQQSEGVAAGTTTRQTVQQRFAAAKMFLVWCWQNHKIADLPRNIRSVFRMKVSHDQYPIRYFGWKGANRDVQRLLSACRARSELFELYVLLALNAGMLHVDIANLRMINVRWKRGVHPRIEWSRSKTRIKGTHLMWGRTRELLERHAMGRYGTDDLVFVTKKGQKLLQIDEDGKTRAPMALALSRIIRQTFGSDDGRSFRHLRKTGARFCADRYPSRGVESLYLSHAPNTMAARFYAPPSQDLLDRALCYMEYEFGVSDHLIKRYDKSAGSDG